MGRSRKRGVSLWANYKKAVRTVQPYAPWDQPLRIGVRPARVAVAQEDAWVRLLEGAPFSPAGLRASHRLWVPAGLEVSAWHERTHPRHQLVTLGPTRTIRCEPGVFTVKEVA